MTVRRDSVRDQVRRTLTERILAGQYEPGFRLVELQIARELGTSQAPVREAFRDLEAAQLVESEPNRGTRVRRVNPKELREAYLLRGLLEEAAAAEGAGAFAGRTGPLRDTVAALLAAADGGRPGDQAGHVYALHRAVVEAAGNGTLLRLWESLALEALVRMRLGWGAVDRVWLVASYDGILAALDRGDGPTAGRLLRAHAETLAPVPGGDGTA